VGHVAGDHGEAVHKGRPRRSACRGDSPPVVPAASPISARSPHRKDRGYWVVRVPGHGRGDQRRVIGRAARQWRKDLPRVRQGDRPDRSAVPQSLSRRMRRSNSGHRGSP
jgi:hypothetical protein